MRSLLFIAVIILQMGSLLAQSTITSTTVYPPNPTTNDTIYIYAALQFPSSDCELDIKDHNLTGTTIGASTLHCLGTLAAICNTVDTFKIGVLPAGNYTFILSLSTGMSPAPCTPGIAVDDTDTVTFLVSESNFIDQITFTEDAIYPNPTNGMVHFTHTNNEMQYLYNSTGKLILKIKPGTSKVDLSGLASGCYVLRGGNTSKKIIITD